MRYSSGLILLFLSLLALSSCGGAIEEISGEYFGSFSDLQNNEKNPAEGLRNYDITAQITPVKDHLEIDILNATDSQVLHSLRVSGSKEKIKISSQTLLDGKETELKVQGRCAENTNAATSVRVCLSSFSLTLIIESRKNESEVPRRIFIYVSKGVGLEASPKPGSSIYSHEDLLDSVKKFTFETQFEAEKAYQAKQNIKVTRGLLFPHLSLRPMISLAEGQSGIADALQYLVPFIFPSRWYDLRRAEAFSEAEKFSYQSLMANQLLATEGMYYSIIRDELYLEEVNQLTQSIFNLYERTKHKENLGFSNANISAVLLNRSRRLQQDQELLKANLRAQYAALSRFLGFSPREGIKSLMKPSFNKLVMPNLTSTALTAQAISRSLEINEISLLKAAAKQSTKSVTYSFLDIASDERASLGLGYVANIRMSKSNIRVLDDKTQQLERIVEEEVTKVLSEYERLFATSQTAIDELSSAEEIVERQKQNLLTGQDFQVADYVDRLDELLQARLTVLNLKLLHLEIETKMNRLLLEGPYKNLPELKPRELAESKTAKK